MSVRSVVSCDVCGVDKREVNHWWAVWTTEAGFHTAPLSAKNTNNQVKHACGSDHASKLYQRWLSTGRLDKAKTMDPANVTVIHSAEENESLNIYEGSLTGSFSR